MQSSLGGTLSISAKQDWPSPAHTDGLSISRDCVVPRVTVRSC